MRLAVIIFVAVLLAGCSRAYYRLDADQEGYATIGERTDDPRWTLPSTLITPPPESRLHDPSDPDHPPLPPDDPAAHRYMLCVNGMKGYQRWHRNGETPWIEEPHWRDYLELSETGELVLTAERSVELGVLHGRDYQDALEDLYLSALILTLNRYEFDLHYFFRNETAYEHAGNSSLPIESNTLTTATDLGFTKAFACGGQLLVDWANTFVWEYTGQDRFTVSSNILINFIQPLLRGAGREVRLESLTQAERNLLYAVRDFARFRKEFYVDIATDPQNGFLSLLLQLQSIRNQRANLASLEQNLRLHEALLELEVVSSIQVDQVFQNQQQGRLALLQAETNLENALDRFKIRLGLPPDIRVHLDDSALIPFQLNDPALNELQDELEKFLAQYRILDAAPPLPKLQEGFRQLETYHGRIVKLAEQIEKELARWKLQTGDAGGDDPATIRERATQRSLEKQLQELILELQQGEKAIDKAAAAVTENTRAKDWETLQRLTRQELAQVSQLFVIQTQVRVYLIRLEPLSQDLDDAIVYAVENRLDLMNERGRVTDAWRKITVAADALEADLDLVLSADIGTEADATNPFDFRAAASRYRAGLRFDSPLDRKAERNAYRASMIDYQRARRAYMAREDEVRQAIRRDLRQLETQRLNFEIARRSLIGAARQVEEAQEKLRVEKPSDISTQNVLIALNAVLQAKNTLISSWVNYETIRVQLLLDLEALQLDDRGILRHEHDDLFHPAAPGGGPGSD